MDFLNREERRVLRSIQEHLNHALSVSNAVSEQIGTVDVYFHPSNSDLLLNCVTPHKGVAWARRDDLLDGFRGLERLGRVPRLVFQDELFPEAFCQQLEIMGLTLEDQRVVMVYHPLVGPIPLDEIPLGCLPNASPTPVSAWAATTRADLATWLRVFNAGYFNTEMITVPPDTLDPLARASAEGTHVYVLASYERAALGAARIALHPPTAQIEAMVTAPLWYGMGLEIGLIMTAVREAEARGCDTLFTIAPPPESRAIYRRLGFEDVAHLVIYWQAEQYAVLSDQPDSASHSRQGENTTP